MPRRGPPRRAGLGGRLAWRPACSRGGGGGTGAEVEGRVEAGHGGTSLVPPGRRPVVPSPLCPVCVPVTRRVGVLGTLTGVARPRHLSGDLKGGRGGAGCGEAGRRISGRPGGVVACRGEDRPRVAQIALGVSALSA